MNKETKQNYIRNSIKVVIDAYNGDVDFYQVDKDDPIATTYGEIYPGLLKDIGEIPKGIKNNIRYSQAMFDIQSEVYRTYHMNNPAVFYNKEDVWQIANQKQSESEEDRKVESAYLIMKLPDRQEEEFVLMVPYTPREKDNMVSWLAALIKQANTLFNQAESAQQSGNWSDYGKYLDELKNVLKKLDVE